MAFVLCLAASLKKTRENVLYQCVIYLAPGDYHGFHSPTDWKVKLRRHFEGYLLSVNPTIANWIGDLFVVNERAVYLGEWKHGFFSMSAVGATNVGSISVDFDTDLVSNKSEWNPGTFCESNWPSCISRSKGQYFGEFNLGSTIVLIFEAPKSLEFKFQEGDVVKMGQSIFK